MSKGKITISSILAFLSGSLGIIGISGWCCTIAGAAVLSFFGLASISTFLVYNNKLLLLASFIFTVLAFYYYVKYKRNKNCSTKKENND